LLSSAILVSIRCSAPSSRQRWFSHEACPSSRSCSATRDLVEGQPRLCSAAGDEVRWDVSVIDDDMARLILADFYRLPDTLVSGQANAR
jgi:hypothetical protein